MYPGEVGLGGANLLLDYCRGAGLHAIVFDAIYRMYYFYVTVYRFSSSIL